MSVARPLKGDGCVFYGIPVFRNSEPGRGEDVVDPVSLCEFRSVVLIIANIGV